MWNVRGASTTSLVIIGRVILLLLVAVATVSAFVLSRGRVPSARDSGARYLCPMHPEVTAGAPGECPICRMALEPLRASSRPATAGGSKDHHDLTATAKRRVFAQEVRAPAWLEGDGRVAALLYKEETVGLVAGEPAWFFRAAEPGAGIAARLTADPPVPWDGSMSRVHFRLERGALERAPRAHEGDVGWVKLAAKSRELLVVASSAVVYSAEGPHVLVVAPDGHTFSKRRVEIGRVAGGLAVVLSGLRDDEPIVAASTFFMDAERRLQAQREETVGAAQ